jgi:hypothetical protein
LGSLPLNPGIETISFSLFSPGHADPNFTFNNSACFSIIVHPSFISSVTTFPPKGITAVCLIIPSLKIAKSVVPPPISMRATPASFSSWLKTALAEASGSSVIPSRSNPALFIHLPIFLMEETCPELHEN